MLFILIVLIEIIAASASVGASNGYSDVASIDGFHLSASSVPSFIVKRETKSSIVASQLDDNLYGRRSHDSNSRDHSHEAYSDEFELDSGHSHAVGGDEDDRLIDSHDHESQHYGPFEDTSNSTSSGARTRNNNDNNNFNDMIDIAGDHHASYQEGDPFEAKTYLTRDLIEKTCQLDRGSQRREQLNGAYLAFCSRYKSEDLLSNEILMSIMHHDSRDCQRILDEFIQLDETINQFDELFIKLLSRYNCHNGYSVKWNCDDCKKAYKDWLCATHLPYYMNGERIKPCISFCERVEQRCPYLHPITREQYGGQPVFICRDPNIPFVPKITPDIPCSEPGKCYDLCHLSDNITELIIDSLSKYDYDKCPDKSSLAGEVRSEQSEYVTNQLLANGSKLMPPPSSDSADYPDQFEDVALQVTIIANRTTNTDGGQTTKTLIGHPDLKKKKTRVHSKKLEELREVLANYKNQAKTHRYHADHSSIDHQPKSHTEIH